MLQVTVHTGKKPAHGGLPSWFSRAASDTKPHTGRSQLEGNRRMLRRQKQHHHSVEDEWLKCHRRCPSSLSRLPVIGHPTPAAFT